MARRNVQFSRRAPPTPGIDRATQEELKDILKALDSLTRS